MKAALIILFAVLLAATGGWLAAPRHAPPGGDPEARLRERAAEYYRASKVLDYEQMAQLFTPARQLRATDKLRESAARAKKNFAGLPPETQADLRAGAATVDPATLELNVEGDWAITSGESFIEEGGQKIPVPLERLVWLRQSGEWWVYGFDLTELNAYGHPPDFAMPLKPDRGRPQGGKIEGL